MKGRGCIASQLRVPMNFCRKEDNWGAIFLLSMNLYWIAAEFKVLCSRMEQGSCGEVCDWVVRRHFQSMCLQKNASALNSALHTGRHLESDGLRSILQIRKLRHREK